MLKFKLWCSGATLALTFANPNVAFAFECKLENGSQGVAPADQFDTGCFANGVRYLLDVNPSLPPSIMLVVNAGTADEMPGQGSAAHVIEHIGLSFYSADDRLFSRVLGQEKIRVINGFTGSRTTSYMIAPDHNFTESDYNLVARVIAEWLTDSAITSASVLRERNSVIAEGAGYNESVRTSFAVASAVYGSRKAQTTMRERRDVGTLDVAALKSFHSKWYRPDLSAVIVTGNIDVAKWKAALSSELGALPLPRSLNPRPEPVSERDIIPNLRQGRRYLTISSTKADEIVVQLTSKRGSFNHGIEGAGHRQDLLREIVRYAVSERQIGFPVGFVAGVMAAEDVDADGAGARFSVKLDPKVDLRSELASKVSAVVVQLKSLRDHGLTENEIRKAKRYVAGQVARDSTTSLEYYGRVAFTKSVSQLPSRSERGRLIESISSAEVNAVVRKLIDLDRNLDIVLIGAGSTGDRNRAMSFVREGFDLGYKAPVPVPETPPILQELAPGLSTPPEPLDVTQIDADTEAFRLPGGQRVVLHKLDGNLSDRGFAAAIEGTGPENGPSLFSRSGMYSATAPMSYLPDGVDTRLAKDFLDSEDIDYNLTVMPQASKLLIRSGGGRVDPLIQAIKVAVTADRRKSVRNPKYVTGLLAGAGPQRGASSSDDSVLRDLIASGDKDFAPRTIVISGDFDLAEARGLVMRYLGDLEPVKLSAVGTPFSMNIEPLIKPARREKQGAAGQTVIYSFSAKYPDDRASDAALAILAEILGSSVLKAHREAGSYRVGAFPTIWRSDKRNDPSVGQLDVIYSVESNLVPKFDAITTDVIRRIGSDQIEPEVFEAAKRKVTEEARKANNAPEASSRALLDATLRGSSLANIFAEQENRVSQATLPEVQAIARLFLDKPMP